MGSSAEPGLFTSGTVWEQSGPIKRPDEGTLDVSVRRIATAPIRRLLDRRAMEEIGKAGYEAATHLSERDVVIVAYPGSGREWFRFLVAGGVFGVDVTLAPVTLVHHLTPDLDRELLYHRYDESMLLVSRSLPRSEFRRVGYLT